MYAHVGARAPVWTADAYVKDELQPIPVDVPGRDSWTVLFFYPRDFTFVCPTELAAFEELRMDFEESGARIVGASTDSWWVHRAWFTTSPWLGQVSYPVIADTSHELARSYGVLADDGAAWRATFVIDPDGIVRHAAATDASVGRSASETLRIVQALQTGELCPANWRPGQATLKAA
ncbi:MAG TPA: peroxiredoxin [Gaiellaceae bacterium]|nr:peroxiredoxin [Gaiellaceae bacterium]